jgi:hypothetical protein
MTDDKQRKEEAGSKFDNNKARFDLIPPRPLWELAVLYAKGAVKYDDRNWEKGISFSRLIAAAFRHFYKWILGENYDDELHIHHLVMVIWYMIALYEMELQHPEKDDRPRKQRDCRFWGKERLQIKGENE